MVNVLININVKVICGNVRLFSITWTVFLYNTIFAVNMINYSTKNGYKIRFPVCPNNFFVSRNISNFHAQKFEFKVKAWKNLGYQNKYFDSKNQSVLNPFKIINEFWIEKACLVNLRYDNKQSYLKIYY